MQDITLPVPFNGHELWHELHLGSPEPRFTQLHPWSPDQAARLADASPWCARFSASEDEELKLCYLP
jgi:hypothetical protein